MKGRNKEKKRRNQSGSSSSQGKSERGPATEFRSDTPDYYAVLGLDAAQSPTTQEIKAAFRKVALEHHPDRLHPSTSGEDQRQVSEEYFKLANEAYSVLVDEGKRRDYDAARERGEFYSSSQATSTDDLRFFYFNQHPPGLLGRILLFCVEHFKHICWTLYLLGAGLLTFGCIHLRIIEFFMWLVFQVGWILGYLIYYVLYAAVHVAVFIGGLLLSQFLLRLAAQLLVTYLRSRT